MQVADALVAYATYCVVDCDTAHASSESHSAADIMDAAQQHTCILLQVASHIQVSKSLLFHELCLDNFAIFLFIIIITIIIIMMSNSDSCNWAVVLTVCPTNPQHLHG